MSGLCTTSKNSTHKVHITSERTTHNKRMEYAQEHMHRKYPRKAALAIPRNGVSSWTPTTLFTSSVKSPSLAVSVMQRVKARLREECVHECRSEWLGILTRWGYSSACSLLRALVMSRCSQYCCYYKPFNFWQDIHFTLPYYSSKQLILYRI